MDERPNKQMGVGRRPAEAGKFADRAVCADKAATRSGVHEIGGGRGAGTKAKNSSDTCTSLPGADGSKASRFKWHSPFYRLQHYRCRHY